MLKAQLVVTFLRILLVSAFAFLVLFQVAILPGTIWHQAREEPDMAHLRWPILVVSDLVILCMQVVIVCTWKLLTMVQEDRIFSHDSLAWVDAIVAAVGAAWVVVFGSFVFVAVRADDPGFPVLLMAVLLGGAVLGLLMVVLRALLRQATTLRTDMEAVI